MSLKLILNIIRLKTLLWFTVSTCLGFSAIILQNIPEADFIYLITTIALVNIGAILINDIGDIKIDQASVEQSKQNRPITSGRISIKTGWVLIFILFILSIIVSLFHSISVTMFAVVVMIFSFTYSLPPFRFCGKPIWSILFWVLLMASCYLLMVKALTGNFNVVSTTHSISLVFILAIISFMGIAEIIAKDLRDYENDALGGRNTFVNYIGIRKATYVMIFTAWLGYCLWVLSLFLSNKMGNTFAIICTFLGFIWCIYVTLTSEIIAKKFKQETAKNLHERWTYVYGLMQLLTFLSFI